MKFHRVNSNTINCIISKEELEGSGLTLEDIIGRKVGAMEYLHRVVLEAARQEHLPMNTGYTSMQVQARMDGSLVLTISNKDPEELTGEDPMKSLREAIEAVLASKGDASKASSEATCENGTVQGEGTRTEAAQTENAQTEVAQTEGASEESDGSSRRQEEANGKSAGRRQYCYRFYALADAAACCRHLPQLSRMETSLWRAGNGDYDLIVSSEGEDVLLEKTILAMNEFGNFTETTPEAVAYIMEHEKCILKENAAAQLIRL